MYIKKIVKSELLKINVFFLKKKNKCLSYGEELKQLKFSFHFQVDKICVVILTKAVGSGKRG